jgi:glycosyltransferase involved in cell wall biosynthesis
VVLFLHLPHLPDRARLETMPFAFNAVKCLAESDAEVTVCLWEQPGPAYAMTHAKSPPQVRFLRERPIRRLGRLHPQIYAAQVAAAVKWNFDYIFAVGQRGLAVAHELNRLRGARIVYFNDEFPSCWPNDHWACRERIAAAGTAAIVVPDACRAAHLLGELGLAGHQTHVLPNSPLCELNPGFTGWRAKLGLPADGPVVLHAGSVADWSQIPELLTTMNQWPGKSSLLIHSRGSEEAEAYRRSLGHLEHARAFWSVTPMNEADLNTLVASVNCTVALYRNLGPNITLMGMSSGKIMRSIVCGTPVIASRFESLNFVEEHGVGVLVNHPSEIPGAIGQVLAREPEMRRNCVRFRDARLDFQKYWNAFWNDLRGLAT